MSLSGPAVLAFGGNALLPDPATLPARGGSRAFCGGPASDDRWGGIVLVHGNGPRVGLILLRIEAIIDKITA